VKNLSFTKEPIVWIGAIVAILMLIQDAMTEGISLESLDAALVAVGSVVGREFVSPVAKKR
jgi:hypothetical protein